MTKQDVIDAVDSYFGDVSRTRGQTKAGLLDILDHIQTQVETLNDEDIHEDEDD